MNRLNLPLSEEHRSNDVSIPMDTVIVSSDNVKALLSDDNSNENSEISEFNDNDQAIRSYNDNAHIEAQQDDNYNQQQFKEMFKKNMNTRRLNTRLLNAIDKNNISELMSCLEDGANPNATCFFLKTSACHAAAYANSDALDILLKYGAEKNRVDAFGRTPLQLAAWAGNNEAIKLLLKEPTDYHNETDLPGAQISSAMNKDPCRITHDTPKSRMDSIDHKCETHMTNIPKFFSDWTPLHVASYAANFSTARLLLAYGADPNKQDSRNQTPLDITGASCFLEEHEVDVNNYVKTIKILIEFEGKFDTQEFPLHTIDCIGRLCNCISALHTAVEMCSVEAIKLLLGVGAHVTYHNGQGNTPLHECVVKCLEEPLELLINHRWPTQTRSAADLTDLSKQRRTVLQLAITNSWIPGVRLALEAGADVTYKVKSIELSAIHVAASSGNSVILREVLEYVQEKCAVSYESEIVDAPIILAMRSGNLDCVRLLIEAGASLTVNQYANAVQFRFHRIFDYIVGYSDRHINKIPEDANHNLLIHAAVDIGDINTLKFLLDHDTHLYALLQYRSMIFMDKTPVEYCIWCIKNRKKCDTDFEILTFLLEKTSGIEQFDPPIFCSILENPVSKHDEPLFCKLLEDFSEVLRTHRSQLLHCAIKNMNEKMILKLITCGADLSATCNGVTAISRLMSVHPHATEFMESIFDYYIDTNEFPVNHKNNQIHIKYNVLVPPQKEPLERMKVLTALLNTGNHKGQTKLLKHLLVETFIHWNWKVFLRFFYILILMYGLFTTALTIYIVAVFYFIDVTEPVPIFFRYLFSEFFWQTTVYIIFIVVLILEWSVTYMTASDTWRTNFIWKFVTYSFCTTTLVTLSFKESLDTDWVRNLASLTLGLAWLNLMRFFASTPMAGFYVQVFWNVTKEVAKILLIFSLLIIMFSSIFMIQFHSKEPFDEPISALVKTLVMMTSEFEFEDNFANSTYILRLIFVLFLLLIAIVIMNLLIGIAVNDVQNLVENGTLRRLEMQVLLIRGLELSMKNKYAIFYYRGIRSWFHGDKVPSNIYINSFKSTVTMYPLVIPSGYIPTPMPLKDHDINQLYMEAILDKVRDRFDQRQNNSSQ